MKKNLLSLIFLLAALIANAQLPSFQWAGGIIAADKIAISNGNCMVSDAGGNVYTTGEFSGSVDFDPGPGVYNLATGYLLEDAFISKVDAFGNLVWVKDIQGTGVSMGVSIALDGSGNVCVVGHFTGTVDFDPGVGADSLAATGSDGMFILKLDPSGNFIFAGNIEGASSSDYIAGNSITLDPADNIYITGYFWGTFDFDPGAGMVNLTTAGSGSDMFILKLDAAGNFVWTKQIAEVSFSFVNANSIILDMMGNIYTTGLLHGTADFDPGAGTFLLAATSSSGSDVFISKYDASGNFIWAKNIGNNGSAYSIKVDPAGNVYTAGYFNGTADFDPGPGVVNLTSSVNNEFISKLDASGNYVWAKNTGGTGSSQASSLVLDGVSNVYTTGCFHGTVDFDPGTGVHNINSLSSINDAFVSKLDASGNFVWAVSMGGAAATDNGGCSIALDASSDIYTFGSFKGTTDFDPGSGTATLTSVGSDDIFIQKLNQANVVTSITENAAENNISIYPNPTNGLFSIALASSEKNISIEIYNSIGELVYSKQNTDTQTLIDLKNNAAGLYFVKIISGNKIIGTKKIVKE